MWFIRFLLLSVFLVLVVSSTANEPHTNAQRFARGLPPLRPRSLFQTDRIANTHPRDTPIACPASNSGLANFLIGFVDPATDTTHYVGYNESVRFPTSVSQAACCTFVSGQPYSAIHVSSSLPNYIGLVSMTGDNNMEPAQPPFVGIVSGAPDESVVRVGSSELFIFHPDLTATWEDVDGSEWPIVFMFDSGADDLSWTLDLASAQEIQPDLEQVELFAVPV